MIQTGSILTILYVKIDPYSGLKIDPEFGRTGQFNPVCVGGILTDIQVTT